MNNFFPFNIRSPSDLQTSPVSLLSDEDDFSFVSIRRLSPQHVRPELILRREDNSLRRGLDLSGESSSFDFRREDNSLERGLRRMETVHSPVQQEPSIVRSFYPSILAFRILQ